MSNFTYETPQKAEILEPMDNRLRERYYREVYSNFLQIFQTMKNFDENSCRIIIDNIFRQMTSDQIVRIVHQFLINPEYHKMLKKLNELLDISDFKRRYNEEKKTNYIFDHIKPPGLCKIMIPDPPIPNMSLIFVHFLQK